MEIEVGDYVRLARNQGINKVIEIENLMGIKRYLLEKEIANEYGDIINFIDEDELDEEIVNHSKDIIDLIEVGDFVNRQEIKLIIEKGQIVPSCYSLETDDKDKTAVRRILFVDEIGKEYIIKIKSILTHEQYERNAYRLEE